MILPVISVSWRNRAQFRAYPRCGYAAVENCCNVYSGQVLSMRREAPVRANRYPSPSIWSDPLRVRPDPFCDLLRRTPADGKCLHNSGFAFAHSRRHSHAIWIHNEDRAEWANLVFWRFRRFCWRFRAAVRRQASRRFLAPAQVPARPSCWTVTWRPALWSVRRATYCIASSIRRAVTEFDTLRAATRAPATTHHKATGAGCSGGLLFASAGAFAPRPNAGRD